MPPSKSCIPCRVRKVKCDTGSPICSPCRRSRANLECFYDPTTLGPHPSSLRRGEACLTCRRKKKRCDGTRPTCSTCARSRIHADCVYEDPSPDSPPTGSVVSTTDQDNPPDARSETTDPSNITELDPPPGCEAAALETPTLASLKNFRPLLFTDYEDPLLYALSDISLEDMNMSFRILFFVHRIQFGLYFCPAKQQAIILGDTSGTVVHPFFIYFAQLGGCHFYQERRGEFFLLHLEAMYLGMAWDSFKDMTEDNDSFDAAQAYLLMSLAYLYSQNTYLGRKLFQKSIALFRRHWANFSASPLSDLTEPLRERIAFLGEAIYTEIDCAFMFGGAQELTQDLEYGFRHELPTAYPQVFESCILWLRLKTIMLARDTGMLLESPIVSGNRAARFLSCQAQLPLLQAHLLDLYSLLKQHGAIDGDHEICVSARQCMIITLVKQAELYDDMRKSSLPSASERTQFHTRCRECLSKVVVTTAELSPEDYYYLDPYLGVCWSRAISLLAEELSIGSQVNFNSQMSLVPSMQIASTFTEGSLDAQISVLRAARRSVGMSVCLVPSGPKTLCNQLMDYGRGNDLKGLGRFTEM